MLTITNISAGFGGTLVPVPRTRMTPRGAKTILVVEDEPLIRMFAAGTLADAGYAVLVAGTGEEALQVIAAGEPLAAVMTDIEMPGRIDGLELARIIDAQWPTIAVVVVSGQHLPRPDELPHQAQFLTKPYSADRLIDTLEAVL
jgi:two-component system, response regulator PdtaR